MKITFAVNLTVSFLVTGILLSLSAVPVQAQTNSNVIYACVQKNTGQTRIVAAAGDCNPSEAAVFWNKVGPQGPAGPVGATGASGAVGPRGPAGGRSFVPGLVSQTSLQICSQEGIQSCQTKDVISFNVIEGGSLSIDLRMIESPVPEDIENVIHIQANKRLENNQCLDEEAPEQTPHATKPCAGENDYHMELSITVGTSVDAYIVNVSPRSPLYQTASDPVCNATPAACPLNLIAELLTDSLLSITTDAAHLKNVVTESIGAISSASIEYDQVLEKDILKVVAWNAGEYKADFLVSVDECQGITPLVAKMRTLNVQESGVFAWELQARDPVYQVGGHVNHDISCKVLLRGPTGTSYDSTIVHRP